MIAHPYRLAALFLLSLVAGVAIGGWNNLPATEPAVPAPAPALVASVGQVPPTAADSKPESVPAARPVRVILPSPYEVRSN